jgi:glucosamine-phosphate N-acetyltransferase
MSNKGFLDVLAQLTSVGNVSQAQFVAQFETLHSQANTYIVVIEDQQTNKIVGAGTIFLERKFIHHCGTVHILSK